jgi:two-component system, CitB family, sensor kinase
VPSEDLVKIVGNLIDNALDALAGGTGGRIDVRLAAVGDRVRLEVRDDGPGIPAEAIDHVFEAGWTTKPGTGTGRRGLGLALVCTAAGRLGGRVDAANDGGAVLTVEVPAGSHATVSTP